VLRSLPIHLLTGECVLDDSRIGTGLPDCVAMHDCSGPGPAALTDAVRSGGMGDWGDEAGDFYGGGGSSGKGSSTGSGKKKRNMSQREEEEEVTALGPEVAASGDRANTSTSAGGGVVRGEGGELGPAPNGHTVKAVEMVKCDETSLSVCWVPAFPDYTESCRLVQKYCAFVCMQMQVYVACADTSTCSNLLTKTMAGTMCISRTSASSGAGSSASAHTGVRRVTQVCVRWRQRRIVPQCSDSRAGAHVRGWQVPL